MNRCDICLDEKCKKVGKEMCCNCNTCKHNKECYKVLHPTIRLTTKCTQECSHCCFNCSPNANKMMSLEKAKEVALFLKNNDIRDINVMGGEFFCNPNWFHIIKEFLSVNVHMRLVSNGDWYPNETVKNNLIELNKLFPNQFYIAISNDRWHTNQYVSDVEKFLKDNNITYYIGTKEEDNEECIVPIGRSQLSFGLYGMFSCYCHNPKNEYSFLIDEQGVIYKCSFGVWDYADTTEFKNGGFAKKFKEFNQKFYSIFIPSCTSCIRCANQGDRIDRN